ncbi:uncharacterized protein A4U43_C01F32880 [Asparagus officinalis]|uniref:Uncharacterized protein n=1 Tax=Asparagus officinalis TaxID=4686 RepID=A0A5P1FU81_ASPOF|nr:uncharacterized protein A4U43_C01F32880 [Asparagus officinalis]
MTKPSRRPSPLSPSALPLRYWARRVSGGRQAPAFFSSKLSPSPPSTHRLLSLAPPTSAPGSSLLLRSQAALLQLHLHLIKPFARGQEGPRRPVGLQVLPSGLLYFTNYASSRTGFSSSFKNYSDGNNLPVDTFRRYSRDAVGDEDSFASYSVGGNVVTTNFTSYPHRPPAVRRIRPPTRPGPTSRTSGSTQLRRRRQRARADLLGVHGDTNSGEESFAGTARAATACRRPSSPTPTTPTSWDPISKNYGEGGNGAADEFSSYGEGGNVPELGFKSYGPTANGGVDDSRRTGTQSNVGDDTFASYGKKRHAGEAALREATASRSTRERQIQGLRRGVHRRPRSTSPATPASSRASRLLQPQNGNQFSFKSYVNASTVPKEAGLSAAEGAEEMQQLRRKKMVGGGPVNSGGFIEEPTKPSSTLIISTEKMPEQEACRASKRGGDKSAKQVSGGRAHGDIMVRAHGCPTQDSARSTRSVNHI